MIYTVGLSCLWNKWNILCTVVKLIWDVIVEDYPYLVCLFCFIGGALYNIQPYLLDSCIYGKVEIRYT